MTPKDTEVMGFKRSGPEAPRRDAAVRAGQVIQYIQDARGESAYAVLPIAAYESLRERAGMFEDVAAFDAAKTGIAAGAPVLPAALVDRLLGGENPIRIWREYHGLTQTALAEAASVPIPKFA